MKDASFALIIEDKKILLTRRLDVPVWVLPGGGIERGESPEEAAIREVFEETGVHITLTDKTHELTPINRLAVPTHLYRAIPKNPPQKTSSETAENRYFPLSNLPKELFWPHRLWIEEALSTSSLIQRPLTEISYRALLTTFLKHPSWVIRYLITRVTKN